MKLKTIQVVSLPRRVHFTNASTCVTSLRRLLVSVDWLRAGKSYQKTKDEEEQSALATALVPHSHEKSSKHRKRKHEKKSEDMVLVVHKKHRKDKKDRKEKHKKHKSRRKHHRRHRHNQDSQSSDSEGDSKAIVPSYESLTVGPSTHHTNLELVPMETGAMEKQLTPPNGLYELDTRGDPDNINYGSLYNPPLYHLMSKSRFQAHHSHSSSVSSDKRPSSTSGRYFGTEARKREKKSRTERLHLAYSKRRLDRQKNERSENDRNVFSEFQFIPVSAVIAGDVHDPSGKLNDAEMEEKECSFIQQTDTENVEQYLVQKNKEFNIHVNAHPNDIKAWLDFTAFQEKSARLSRRQGEQISEMVLEKQRAILDKALIANPDDSELRKVYIRQLLQSMKTSREVQAEDIIEKLLEQDPSNCSLWMKRIQVDQQNFGSFSVSHIRELYARAMYMVRKHGASKDAKRTHSIAKDLLDLHLHMCAMEWKIGHQERAIAQVQALLVVQTTLQNNQDAFNLSDISSQVSALWTQEDIWYGDTRHEVPGMTAELVSPSQNNYAAYLRQIGIQTIRKVNPPDAVLSSDHQHNLLQSSQEYLRHHERMRHQSTLSGEAVTKQDDQKKESTDNYIYSNTLGYRIKVEDANEKAEYERILNELRESEYGHLREEEERQRQEKKDAIFASVIENVEDQRAAYKPVGMEDKFLRWLLLEEKISSEQWHPCRTNDGDEEQSSMAVQSDDVQPFLFQIPDSLFLDTVYNLLKVMGVSTMDSEDTYAYMDDFNAFPELIEPILDALDPTSQNSLILSAEERKSRFQEALYAPVRVDSAVLKDPSKVQFIRNAFSQGIADMKKMEKEPRQLQCTWIAFEAQVLKSLDQDERQKALQAIRQYWKHNISTSHSPHWQLMYAYAQLEAFVGDVDTLKQICSAMIQPSSASSPQLSQQHQPFTCLQTQSIVLSKTNHSDCTMSTTEELKLRMLQGIYLLWYPWRSNWETLQALQEKHRDVPHLLLEELKCIIEAAQAEQDVVEIYENGLNKILSETSSTSPDIHVARFCVYNICLAVCFTEGFEKANERFRQLLSDERLDTLPRSDRRWLWAAYLNFCDQQSEFRLLRLSPREWRSAVSTAVEHFPLDPFFLRLFADAESATTVSQTLRKYFERVKERSRRYFHSPQIVEWLFALLCEFQRLERMSITRLQMAAALVDGREMQRSVERRPCCFFHKWEKNQTGINRIRKVLHEMITSSDTEGCAIGWRVLMRFEVAAGKVENAKKILRRGMVKCPWSKQLYLDGIRVLRPYLNDEESMELIDFMTAKEIVIRETLD